MSLLRLMNQPLTVQTVGGTSTDEYGNEVTGAIGDPVPVSGFLEQKDTTEYINGRETTVTRWTAILPATADIHPMDYINFESQKFQVDGEPDHKWNPRVRAVSHIECKLTVAT